MLLSTLLALAAPALAGVPRASSILPLDGLVLCDPDGYWDGRRCVPRHPVVFGLKGDANLYATLHNAVLDNNAAERGDTDAGKDPVGFLEAGFRYLCEDGACDADEATAIAQKTVEPYLAYGFDSYDGLDLMLSDAESQGGVSPELAKALHGLMDDAEVGGLSDAELHAEVDSLLRMKWSEQEDGVVTVLVAVSHGSGEYWGAAGSADQARMPTWLADALGAAIWNIVQPDLPYLTPVISGMFSAAYGDHIHIKRAVVELPGKLPTVDGVTEVSEAVLLGDEGSDDIGRVTTRLSAKGAEVVVVNADGKEVSRAVVPLSDAMSSEEAEQVLGEAGAAANKPIRIHIPCKPWCIDVLMEYGEIIKVTIHWIGFP